MRSFFTLVILGALCSVPAAIGLRPVTDLDIWWHLRQAAWIVEQRTLPVTDPFTSYGTGKTWIAYSWLYEIAVYGLYRIFGLFGIVVYTTALAVGITFALYRCLRRQTGDMTVAAGLTMLAIAAMYPVLIEPRPWLFNILFVILELALLIEVRRSGRTTALWGLPPLFIVWASINIQFIYGLFIVAAATLEAFAAERWNVLRDADAGFRTRPMVLTLIGCMLATCLTPYHIGIYVPVATAIKLTDPFLFLQELQAPSFRFVYDWAALGLLLAATFAVGRYSTPPFLVLLLATSAFLAFRAHRDVWLLAIVSAIVLARAPLGRTLERAALRRGELALSGLVVGLFWISLAVTRASGAELDRAISAKFPAEAAAFMESRDYRGRVYNHYDWGGYLMWRLPRIDVALDGRNPLHGDARIRESIRTWNGHPGWASDPELARANIVVADVNMPLSSLLRKDSRFVLVHEDAVAAVFVAGELARIGGTR